MTEDTIKAVMRHLGAKGGRAGKGRDGTGKGLAAMTPEARTRVAKLGQLASVAARRRNKLDKLAADTVPGSE